MLTTTLRTFFLLVLMVIGTRVNAQDEVMISGQIIDSLSVQPIGFVTVTSSDNLSGTVSSEEGLFQLRVRPDGVIRFSLMGYRQRDVPVSELKSEVRILLSPVAIDLAEVNISPKPPEYFLRLAMRDLPGNYPASPFNTRSYYREIIRENGSFLRAHEGVFKSHFPNFQDTVRNQHQLLLFRQAETLSDLAFMKKERLKEEAKEKRKEEKAVRKGKAKPAAKKSDADSLQVGELFGGPENLLRLADLFREEESVLDTNSFKSYTFSYAPGTVARDPGLMVIDFASRGKVDQVRSKGRIFLDLSTNAIVRVESRGEFVVPALLRPVLLVLGIGVRNPTFSSNIVFRSVSSRWYPSSMQFRLDARLERKRLFAENDISHFVIDGVLSVNRIDISDVAPIPKEKRFSGRKRPEPQVHNDEGLSWDQVNVVPR
ncbi:MAG: carboxypeptidase-like regulatory domain-containing protein [Bacteroidota bacterium]